MTLLGAMRLRSRQLLLDPKCRLLLRPTLDLLHGMFSARSILAYSVHSTLKSLVTAHYQPVQVVDLECMLHKLLLTKQHAFERCVHYNFGSTICTCNN